MYAFRVGSKALTLDAPIMLPFIFAPLFFSFIASNHFYSLPSTFCPTLPGDLASVSISLLSLFQLPSVNRYRISFVFMRVCHCISHSVLCSHTSSDSSIKRVQYCSEYVLVSCIVYMGIQWAMDWIWHG